MLSKYKKISFPFLTSFALIAMLFAGNAGVASANNGNDNKRDVKERMEISHDEKVKQNTDLHINSNGRMTMLGAKVISVSGNSLVAQVTFGSLNISWNVVADGNTKITREKEGTESFADIKVGDLININGLVDQSASSPTVKATHIKNLNLITALKGNLFQGKLVSLISSTTPATAVINLNGSNYPVVIPSGISILGNNWLSVSLSSFQTGNNIRVYGTLSSTSPVTITASVIRNTSL